MAQKMYAVICCTLFLIVWSSHSYAQEYLDVLPGYRVELPGDFFYKKNYRVQWWYVTGHLFNDTGREFGYELTFFVVAVQNRDYRSEFGVNNIYISHFAISDLQGNQFYTFDQSDTGAFDFAGARADRLHVWVGKNSLQGTLDSMRIRASHESHEIELSLMPAKPLVLNGDKGYSRKSAASPLIASIYLSYTDLDTRGRLKLGENTFDVKGTSWFDREISSRGLDDHQKGWDWFAIQLDDHREVMLYLIRNRDGTLDPHSSGTLVHPDGTSRHLSLKDFSVDVLAQYTSSKTGAQYPSRWKIQIPSEEVDLTVTPLMDDQEFLGTYTTFNYYWEGTCKVEGAARGRAYVELTGY